ncbi:MAG: MFS transporter, partial [Xanthomonadaceae bacterium]|nr:MFS transporter [Xanthomonadaceae bacterium]
MNKQKSAKKPSLLKAFAQPSAWTMFFLGLASGLPFLLPAGTLSYWLHDSGLDIKNITMIASAGLAYSLKFLWSPLVDRLHLPLLKRFGQRRSWLLLAQSGVMAGLLLMSWIGTDHLGLFIGCTLLVAFAGATIDIAVDAYRIEIAPTEAQGALIATYSLGYRVGLIVAGAMALALSDLVSWSRVYQTMAAIMAIPVIAVLLAREPTTSRIRTDGWRQSMYEGVVAPFVDFFVRYRMSIGLLLLLFVLIFKISDQALVGGLMGPFYRAQGFEKTEIAAITKIYGIWVGMVGTFLGGVAVAWIGIRRSLLIGIVIGAVSNLLY